MGNDPMERERQNRRKQKNTENKFALQIKKKQINERSIHISNIRTVRKNTKGNTKEDEWMMKKEIRKRRNRERQNVTNVRQELKQKLIKEILKVQIVAKSSKTRQINTKNEEIKEQENQIANRHC